MEIPDGTLALRAFFVVMPIALAVLTVWGVYAGAIRVGDSPARARRLAGIVAGVAAGWMAATWAIAASGLLLQFDLRPPPFAIVPLVMVALGVWLARSRVGDVLARGLPLWVLVGVQSFRLPLELMMDRAAQQGVMPVQMSFAGHNFDILTGMTAAMLAITMAMRPVPRGLVHAWNAGGLLLLVNIVVVSILSTPVVGAYGPDRYNVWVMTAPYVSLPAVMVLTAWAGHLVVFRALRVRVSPRRPSAQPGA
ncbi:MAG: hypothetical protein Q8L86_14645 [Vicinamibacterales bacterium]|nr:hypothetical protein [Vicinamibacterales bacterium]